MNIEKIIFDELNDWVFNVEDQAGNKMNVVEDCDFKEIIPKIVKKLMLNSVLVPKGTLFCGECGDKRELIVTTDINSGRICKNALCKAK